MQTLAYSLNKAIDIEAHFYSKWALWLENECLIIDDVCLFTENTPKELISIEDVIHSVIYLHEEDI